jgi:hypothetical protein
MPQASCMHHLLEKALMSSLCSLLNKLEVTTCG